MQNAGLSALGLNWRYLAFEVPPDDLERAISGAKAMRFVGLNLTVPHKMLAVPMVDVLDASGKRWGAINTVRFEGSRGDDDWKPLAAIPPEEVSRVRSVGFNTDADAVVRSLREDLNFEPRGRSVLILGAGGAGSVAALRLAEEGARLFLQNRTTAKAAEISRSIRERFPSADVQLGYPPSAVDLVLNATSLGLKSEDPLPFDHRQFALGRAGAVYDMIYRPAETKLLQAARAAGRPTANGLGMLLYQGARALESWTEQPAPLAPMKQALLAAVYRR
jgi:shikimate dehydrogenase